MFSRRCYTGQFATSIFRATPYRDFVTCYTSQLSAQFCNGNIHVTLDDLQHNINSQSYISTVPPRSSKRVNLKPKASSYCDYETPASFSGLENFPSADRHISSFIKEISFSLTLSTSPSLFVSFSLSKTRISLPSPSKDC